MKATDDLYQLVKSLTSSERRYFKIFSKRHVVGKVNKYEILFNGYYDYSDLLPYDEQVLKACIKDKNITKNFADEKKNLHEMIMRAMRTFHAGVSVESQLYEILTDEDYYKNKRLNQLRLKAIEKGKEIAEKYERYNILLTLIERGDAANLELNQDTLKERSLLIGKEKKQLLEKIGVISQLKEVNDWMFIHYRIYADSVPEEFWVEADRKMADPVIRDYKMGFCFSADLNYIYAWSLYYLMKGDAINCAKYQSLAFDLYEVQYPHMKLSNRIGHKISIYNYINGLNAIKDFEKTKELLDYAETIPAMNEDEAGEDFQNIAFFKQLYYNNTMQFDKAAEMTGEIQSGIKKYRKKVNKARELAMMHSIIVSYMMLERWDEVVAYAEKIIGDKSDARQDIKHGARLYQFIARFELEEYDKLTTHVRNTQRWIDTKNALSHTYNNVLKLLHMLLREGKPYFNELGQDFDKKMSDYGGYPAIQIWVYARVHKIPIRIAAGKVS